MLLRRPDEKERREGKGGKEKRRERAHAPLAAFLVRVHPGQRLSVHPARMVVA